MADQVLRRDAAWAAPFLLRTEFCNVLALHVRARRMNLSDAQLSLGKIAEVIQDRFYAVSDGDVLNRAAESGCTAYDCEFVVLADMLGVPLVTSDREILKAFPRIARSPSAFAD